MAASRANDAISDPDLRDRLYELLEHDHLPYSVGSRFVRLIVAIIVVDVLAMILASVPEFDARFGRLFTAIEVAAVVAFALEYVARLWSVVGHSLRDMTPTAGAAGICVLQPRHHRSAGVPAVGDRAVDGRPPHAGAVRHAAVPQTGALFAGAALAARGPPCRAAHAVRLRRDPDRRGAAVRLAALCHRAQGAARQVRHHPAGDVVGDRDARHRRLWRRGAGNAARQDGVGVRRSSPALP